MSVHLNTVGVVVADMSKSLTFYRMLGLSIEDKENTEEHVEYVSPQGYTIGFVTEAMVRQSDDRWSNICGDRLNLQFRFDTPSEVDKIHRTLIEAGYASYQEPWDAFWGQRFARVIDPDRNVVNLFCPLSDS